MKERDTWDGMPEKWHKMPPASLPEVFVSFSPQVGVQIRQTGWAVQDLNL